jgi:hypothetical protein
MDQQQHFTGASVAVRYAVAVQIEILNLAHCPIVADNGDRAEADALARVPPIDSGRASSRLMITTAASSGVFEPR